jgi:hypothetical protein
MFRPLLLKDSALTQRTIIPCTYTGNYLKEFKKDSTRQAYNESCTLEYQGAAALKVV